MSDVLYAWPPAAAFGRVVPKAKLYEHARVSARLRQKFVDEVQRVTWAFKLADETIHLAGDTAVPEIQVFVVKAKEADVSDEVLTAIDKSVRTPIVFEIERGEDERRQVRMTAAHKQPGTSSPRLSERFSTGWLPHGAGRAPLPPALDLPGLYAQLLTPLLPFPPRPGETVAGAAARAAQAGKLKREVAQLERKLRNEPQLNRKVELRQQLRQLNTALAALTAP
ncbi:MAG: hypothetical protein UZ13_02268 [Chloroflexi bacterium OLB13]|nr:MAG: hypothetical protein UZ13_02268 [Chloroflexi bacterium OLB13]